MDTFTNNIYEVVGVAGFILYLAAYCLLQTGLLAGRRLTYIALNLVASCLVLSSLILSFNLAILIIQLIWVLLSLLGLIRHYLPEQTQAEQHKWRDEQLSHWNQCA